MTEKELVQFIIQILENRCDGYCLDNHGERKKVAKLIARELVDYKRDNPI